MVGRRQARLIAAVTAVGFVLGPTALAATGEDVTPSEWISRAYDGTAPNDISQTAAISADGRYAVYASLATNLVQDVDVNHALDVFLRDMTTGEVILISRNSSELAAGGEDPEISADGRFVAFCSAAGLVAEDTNGALDIYVYRVKTGQSLLVSTTYGGTPSEGGSCTPSISADGRFIAFESAAADLVPGDQNDGLDDIFVTNWRKRSTILASHTPAGGPASRDSNDASISANGRYVSYHSYAPDLVAGDDNNTQDVIVYDRRADQNTRASSAPDGTAGNKGSARAAMSANGRFVAYQSAANDLVTGDTNGAIDVFRTAIRSGRTVLVTLDPNGGPIAGQSMSASLSADGRHVTFASKRADHVPGLIIEDSAIFLRDLVEGITILVSQYSDGSPTQRRLVRPELRWHVDHVLDRRPA